MEQEEDEQGEAGGSYQCMCSGVTEIKDQPRVVAVTTITDTVPGRDPVCWGLAHRPRLKENTG